MLVQQRRDNANSIGVHLKSTPITISIKPELNRSPGVSSGCHRFHHWISLEKEKDVMGAIRQRPHKLLPDLYMIWAGYCQPLYFNFILARSDVYHITQSYQSPAWRQRRVKGVCPGMQIKGGGRPWATKNCGKKLLNICTVVRFAFAPTFIFFLQRGATIHV